jgi:hypothetical protein
VDKGRAESAMKCRLPDDCLRISGGPLGRATRDHPVMTVSPRL